MSTRVVVELTADEDRILNAFRRATAADEKMRAGLARTGATVGDSGRLISEAMAKAATQTGASVDRMIGSLRQTGAVGRKLGNELSQFMSDFEIAGKKSVYSIVEQLERVDSTVATQAHIILEQFDQADKAEKFSSTIKQIEDLGGEYAKLGQTIRKSTAEPMDGAKASADALVRELEKIDPSKAQAIQAAMAATRTQVEQTRLDELLRVLSASTDEARQLSSAVGDGISQAALEAKGGIEEIATEIVALRPELSGFVEQWKTDVADAARYGEGQFKKMLDELRSGDKVSRQVAESIKKELVAAGMIGEKSFEDMIAPLKKLHPTLAAQAVKMKSEFDAIEAKGKGSFSGIAGIAKRELAIIAGSYLGIQEAIQAVTQSMQDQEDLRRDAAKEQRSVAEVEATARQNLASYTPAQRDYLLGDFVKEVMEKTTFSDRKALITAVGAVASSGAKDAAEIQRVVMASAKLTAPTPGLMSTMAPALVDVGKATGSSSPEQSASIVLQVASEARIVEPEKVFRNLPPVMAAGFQAAPEGQGLEGALQAGALMAALTRGATDSMGDSSQTAGIQLVQRMQEFFKDLREDSKSVQQAKRDLSDFKTDPQLSEQQQLTLRQLQDRQANAAKTDASIVATRSKIESLDNDMLSMKDPRQKRDAQKQISSLKKQLADLESSAFDDAAQAKLLDLLAKLPGGREYEAKVAELQRKIDEGTIPGADRYAGLRLPEQQAKAFQQDPKLLESFLDEKFGEQKFRPLFEGFARGGATMKQFESTLQLLRSNVGNTKLFDQMSGEMIGGSPQLQEATNQRRAEIGQTNQLTDDVTSSLANFRESLMTTLRETRSPNASDAFAQYLTEPYQLLGGPGGSRGPEEVVSGIQLMMARKADLELRGVTAEEKPLIERLKTDIEAAISRLATQNLKESSPEKIIAARRRADDALRLETGGGTQAGGFTKGGATPGSQAPPDEFRVDVLRRLTETLDTQLPERDRRGRTPANSGAGQSNGNNPDSNAQSSIAPRDTQTLDDMRRLMAEQVDIGKQQLEMQRKLSRTPPLPSNAAIVQASMAKAGSRP